MTDAQELKIEVGKRYILSEDHDGHTVMVLEHTERGGNCPWLVYSYDAEGDFFVRSENIVKEYVEPPKPEYVWLNVYNDNGRLSGADFTHLSREDAAAAADDAADAYAAAKSERVGCIKVELRAEFDDE